MVRTIEKIKLVAAAAFIALILGVVALPASASAATYSYGWEQGSVSVAAGSTVRVTYIEDQWSNYRWRSNDTSTLSIVNTGYTFIDGGRCVRYYATVRGLKSGVGSVTFSFADSSSSKTITVGPCNNHLFVESSTTATCESAGISYSACSRCSESLQQEVDALGHQWGDWVVTKSPTNTTPGIESRTCARNASHVETRAIPSLSRSVYRLYNPASSEHLFTTTYSEYEGLVQHGWKQEGECWRAPADGVPVYRLYNAGLGAMTKMSHHYTSDRAEIEVMLRNGWTFDFKGEPVFYSADENTSCVPVFRLYNDGLSAHHFTLDEEEYVNLIANHGWDDEDVAFYAYRSDSGGSFE